MMDNVMFNIYPSLLDKYQRLMDAQSEFESPFNEDSESGDGYKKSYDEIEAELESQLLDAINRVDHGPIEAADKGTAFNEIVDCLIENRNSANEKVKLKSAWQTEIDGSRKLEHITAEINGFSFCFDGAFCMSAAHYFAGSIPQHRCEATIDTRFGVVMLYGVIDEIRENKVFDIKTTKSYDGDKFVDAWQKLVYPYCLTESGEVDDIAEFEYTIYQLKGGSIRNPVITGEQYRETYPYNHEDARVKLRVMLESFIEWLNDHRDQITDKKIFNFK